MTYQWGGHKCHEAVDNLHPGYRFLMQFLTQPDDHCCLYVILCYKYKYAITYTTIIVIVPVLVLVACCWKGRLSVECVLLSSVLELALDLVVELVYWLSVLYTQTCS